MTYQLTLATLTLAVSASIATAKVWINELHYDNSGADANEFVEIVVAPDMAGIDLSTVDVHLYNGATGARYDTINFAAPTSQSSQNGFGVYSVSFAPLQNGAPDGLALAINGTLVAGQFLSYEGVFAGVGGPADGLLSIDLGVAETSSTASDESIQLTGVGDEYPDFLWTDPAVATPGMINFDQSFVTVAIPEPSAMLYGGGVFLSCLAMRRRQRLKNDRTTSSD